MSSGAPTPSIQPNELALGTVFKYPNQINNKQFRRWAEGEDFEFDQQQEGIAIQGGSGGMRVEGAAENLGRRDDDFEVLYQEQGRINGVGDCSFVTVKDTNQARFEDLQKTVESLWSFLSDQNIKNQIAVLEMTLEGRVQFDDPSPLTPFYSSNSIEDIEAVTDVPAKGITVQFEADSPPEDEGWFRLLFDVASTNNPTVWNMRYQKRYPDIDSVPGDQTTESIQEYIQGVMEDGSS